MAVIYVKLRAIFQPNGCHIVFLLLKWDHYFIFGFLCLIKPDSDRISTLEPFISQKNVAPLPELIVRPQRPLLPKMVLLSAL